jgi:hypothetical protein
MRIPSIENLNENTRVNPGKPSPQAGFAEGSSPARIIENGIQTEDFIFKTSNNLPAPVKSVERFGWVYDLPIEEYHLDKNFTSSTGLRKIQKSPANFLAYTNGELDKEDTDSRRFGNACHTALLEGTKFWERYVLSPEFGDMRSSKNREKRDAWLSELPPGISSITEEDLSDLKGVVESVLGHKDAIKLLKNSSREVSGYYQDEETGIFLRIRPDILSNDISILTDFKTTKDCSLEGFSKEIWKWRYDFQIAMYGSGVKAISGRIPEFHAFLCVETCPPYECAVWIADDALLEIGQRDYRKALIKLKECQEKNEWPQAQTKMEMIGLPYWAMRESSL